MKIIICVGSSCHLKGSNVVISELEKLIEENALQDKVDLKASFCVGRCTQGVSATLNGKAVNCLTKDNVEEFFYQKIVGDIDHECHKVKRGGL